MHPLTFVNYRYEWTKDGQPLTITGVHIKKRPGVGTLIIEDPNEDDDGLYQCKATSEYGTAISVKTILKAARKNVIELFSKCKRMATMPILASEASFCEN